MVNVPISGLLDGSTIRIRSAEAIFEQDGTTFKGPTRPNAPSQINILNQDQLESELGTNLELPPSATTNIVLDASLSLTKSIKFDLDSVLNIKASTSDNILSYSTNLLPLFQNLDPDIAFAKFTLENLTLVGDDNDNDVFDVIGNAQSEFVCRDVVFQDFNRVGTVDTGSFDFTACSMRNVNAGIVFKNQGAGRVDRVSLSQPVDKGMTAISFIAGVNPMRVTVDTFRARAFAAGNSLLFIDPNAPAGSTFSITDSDPNLGDFYQLGATDILVITVADNGSGKAEFTTTIPHGLVVGNVIILKSFLESTYNGVFIVTAIDGLTFDVDEIIFVATDNGDVTASSLDQTDVRVIAHTNVGQQPSMAIGGFILNTAIAVPIQIGIGFQDFNFTVNPASQLDNQERFILIDGNIGEFEYQGDPIAANLTSTLNVNGGDGSNTTGNYEYKIVVKPFSGIYGDIPDSAPSVFTLNVENDTQSSTFDAVVFLNKGDRLKPQIAQPITIRGDITITPFTLLTSADVV